MKENTHILHGSIYVCVNICTEKGPNGKQQLLTVCYKWKIELANFYLFAPSGNGKGKFVFLGRQMITGDR